MQKQVGVVAWVLAVVSVSGCTSWPPASRAPDEIARSRGAGLTAAEQARATATGPVATIEIERFAPSKNAVTGSSEVRKGAESVAPSLFNYLQGGGIAEAFPTVLAVQAAHTLQAFFDKASKVEVVRIKVTVPVIPGLKKIDADTDGTVTVEYADGSVVRSGPPEPVASVDAIEGKAAKGVLSAADAVDVAAASAFADGVVDELERTDADVPQGLGVFVR